MRSCNLCGFKGTKGSPSRVFCRDALLLPSLELQQQCLCAELGADRCTMMPGSPLQKLQQPRSLSFSCKPQSPSCQSCRASAAPPHCPEQGAPEADTAAQMCPPGLGCLWQGSSTRHCRSLQTIPAALVG
ncbi:unnamed protein product [Coccothraustes coccothraustes]